MCVCICMYIIYISHSYDMCVYMCIYIHIHTHPPAPPLAGQPSHTAGKRHERQAPFPPSLSLSRLAACASERGGGGC